MLEPRAKKLRVETELPKVAFEYKEQLLPNLPTPLIDIDDPKIAPPIAVREEPNIQRE
jgi:hypothetical protein